MAINLMDVSNYQQYRYGVITPANLLPVDWAKMKAEDPRHFAAVWCKCGEYGSGYASEDYIRQAKGAEEVGMSAGPYYYWRYGVAAKAQAQEFFDQSRGYPGKLPPLMDIEDANALTGLSAAPGTWAAKQYRAEQVFLAIDSFAREVELVFGQRPVIYTGAWWWNSFVNILMTPGGGAAQDARYQAMAQHFSTYDCYAAAYTDLFSTMAPTDPAYYNYHCRFLHEICWQYTSTPKPPVAGVGVFDRFSVAGGAVDCGIWLGDVATFNKWAHQNISPTPEPEPTPDPTPVPTPSDLEDRVKVLEDKLAAIKTVL